MISESMLMLFFNKRNEYKIILKREVKNRKSHNIKRERRNLLSFAVPGVWYLSFAQHGLF